MACEIARRNHCATVCLNSNRVAVANEVLKGSDVGIAAVVGFPFGASHMDAKAREAALAIADGATEIDMVVDIGRLKDGQLGPVRADIASVVHAAGGHAVKVILECARLTEDEKRTGCALAIEAGVALIRAAGGPTLGIKASGGILYYEDAVAMVEAGATRLGMSHTQQVLDSIPA